MYQIDEIKKSYTRIKKRVATAIIGGVAFLAAVIAYPTNDIQRAKYDYDLTGTVENVITKGALSSAASHSLFDSFNPGNNDLMSQWTEELDALKEYDYDWDGEGALAVHSETITTAKELLAATDAHVDCLSEIYPTPLGTVCLEWRYGHTTINAEIARRRTAFYIDKFSDGSEVSEYYKAERIDKNLIDSLNASFA